MADVNQVILIGRLVRDAELKYTATGQAVSKFSLAVIRSVKQGDDWKTEPNYFDVVLWGCLAESLNQYLLKGKQIAVTGELRQERWERDGAPRSKVGVVAENIQLLGGGKSENGSAPSESKPSGKPQEQATGKAKNHPPGSGNSQNAGFEDGGYTDDIPF